MNEQLQQKLVELADKLNVAVDHLWGVIVWQMQLDGLIGLFLTVVVFSIFVILCFNTKKLVILFNDISEGMAGLLIPIWLVVVIFNIFSFLGIKDNVTKIFNPEFAALNYLLELLK